MTVYRSKPQHVEAVQWTGENLPTLVEALGSKVRFETIGGLQLRAGKGGAQGWVPVPVGPKYELPDTPSS